MKPKGRKSTLVGRRNQDGAPLTFAEQFTKALDEKVETPRGTLTLAQLAAIKLWQRVLRGEKNAIRDWERLRELAGEFDVKSPMIFVIRGGLTDTDVDTPEIGRDK